MNRSAGGDANLQGAKLGYDRPDTDSGYVRGWREIKSLQNANISGVNNAPPGFQRWAIDTMGAVEIPSTP
jgi:hypothetical protein